MNTDPKWLTWATTGIQPLDLVELILGENKERAKNIYPVHIKHLIDNEDTEEIGWKHLKTIIATTKMEAKEQKETNRFSAIACGEGCHTSDQHRYLKPQQVPTLLLQWSLTFQSVTHPILLLQAG